MNMIKFENISKSYDNVNVLSDFNLTINEGEFITVIGSSGCGKTTTLKLINGLETPNQGTVYIDGKDISKINQTALRRTIGYVIQGAGLFPHMTIEQNISYVCDLVKNDKKRTKDTVNDLINMVDLDIDILQRYPDALSGGQKQRVGIARALANNPRILLMDEPFGAVDEITRKGLQEEFIKLQNKLNLTIFFVTHDINEALKLGHKVLVMNKGLIEQFDTPYNLIHNPTSEYVKRLVETKKI